MESSVSSRSLPLPDLYLILRSFPAGEVVHAFTNISKRKMKPSSSAKL
jgi:hypothetical protein